MPYQRFGLQNKFRFIVSPEMTLKLGSGADFGCNRHCKTNPVDLEGSRGQVLGGWGGFWTGFGVGVGGEGINVSMWPKAGYDASLTLSLRLAPAALQTGPLGSGYTRGPGCP